MLKIIWKDKALDSLKHYCSIKQAESLTYQNLGHRPKTSKGAKTEAESLKQKIIPFGFSPSG